MIYDRDLIFEGGFGDDGPTFTPQQPGTGEQGTPVPVVPPKPVTPTPATTVVLAAPVAPPPTPRRAPTALPVPVVIGEPRFAAADYAAAARALMPRGRAWSVEPGGVQAKLLAGIARTLARIDAAAQALLGGSRPGELTPALPEWEATLGLPDPCLGGRPSTAQRLDQVRGRFVGLGGQSRQHYVEFAAALGFEIEIVTHAPFRVGQTPVGQPVAESQWAFVWNVRIVSTTGALPPAVLLCELQAVKPAETVVALLT